MELLDCFGAGTLKNKKKCACGALKQYILTLTIAVIPVKIAPAAHLHFHLTVVPP